MTTRIPRLKTSEGTNTGSFDSGDWVLLLTVAMIWGSSFLWIAIGLDSFSPASVAFLRILLGAVVLLGFPSARQPVDKQDWPRIALVGVLGNAMPSLLFALAQEEVASSVAGMINASTPLAVLTVSIVLAGRRPGSNEVNGLLIGFAAAAAKIRLPCGDRAGPPPSSPSRSVSW